MDARLHPAAVVWHHRRNSIGGYWRQQRGYGKAEALLERKWPEKHNTAGHIPWTGRVYREGLMQTSAGAGGESITVRGGAHRSSPSTSLLQKGFGRYPHCPSGTW